ncbi:MAG: hypothetical protein JJE25_07535, partial [Bacteroidia bacterium]|nr:hypothetical protein [Bacteroidia bacterium]
MDNLILPTKEEIDAEVKRVMNFFCEAYKARFMSHDESYYEIAKLCGKDTSTFKDMIENPGNCEVRSMVQALYAFGYSIEIN